jgi:hypothetical protein
MKTSKNSLVTAACNKCWELFISGKSVYNIVPGSYSSFSAIFLYTIFFVKRHKKCNRNHPVELVSHRQILAFKGTVSGDGGYFFEGLSISMYVLSMYALMVFKVFQTLFTTLYNY